MLLRKLLIVLVAGLVMCTPVQADPWPNYSSHTDYVGYVHILPMYNVVTTMWSYLMSIDAGAMDMYGPVIGVKALAVYPNAGNPVPGLSGWTGYDTPCTLAGWGYNGGWVPGSGAFGYLTGSPTYYVEPGDSDVLIGCADYGAYWPPDQTFLVHVSVCAGGMGAYTYWARPDVAPAEIVPEPAAITALAVGLISCCSTVIRRRRRV